MSASSRAAPTVDGRSLGELEVEWLHHGPGSQLWLRIRLPDGSHEVPADVLLEHLPTGTRQRVHAMPRVYEQVSTLDASIDLARLVGSCPDPTGDWTVSLHADDPARADHETGLRAAGSAATLPPIRVAGATGAAEVTPHPDANGRLALAVRRAGGWAEVTGVSVAGDVLHVSGRIVGVPAVDAGEPPTLVARRRSDGEERGLSVDSDGAGFSATISGDALPGTGTQQAWDLWLRTSHPSAQLRLGRQLDDIANKKDVLFYPWRPLAVTPPAEFRPYYTVEGNLSVLVRERKAARRVAAARTGKLSRNLPSRRPLGGPARVCTGLVLRALEWLTRHRRVSADEHAPTDSLRVHILMFGIDGLGGTIRTVLNIARYLVDQGHDVRLVPVYRTRADSFFPIDPRIPVEPLCDVRERRIDSPGGGIGGSVRRLLHRRTSWLVHAEDNRFDRCSLWTDLQLVRKLWSIRTGALVTTKQGLNLIGARFAHPGVATLAQEHLTFSSHGPAMQREIRRHFGKLDALTVLSREDREAYATVLRGKPTRIEQLYNALPADPAPRGDPAAHRVIAAGRLAPMKGFDYLIRAFAQATEEHPDWELRIYGSGPWKQKLRRLIAEHGLTGRALLMGSTDRMAQEMAKGSIFALSSRFEPFGMVLTEALSCGLAVVSFDCPHGPGEIITPEVNGLLVPPKDVEALAGGLRRLMEDDDLRRRLASTGPTTLDAYSMDAVGSQWIRLLRAISHRPPVRA